MTESNKNTNNLEAFFKGSLILVVSNICLKAINFFLLPLYTSYLTPGMLGVSDTISTVTAVLLPLLTMGLDSAYSAFYFEKDDVVRSAKVFSTLTVAFFLLGLVPFFGFFIADLLSVCMFHTSEYSVIVRMAMASISFNLWYLPFSLELRLQNRMAAFGFVNVVSSLLMILLNVLFVSVMHLGEYSLVLSTMLVHGAQIILFALFVKKFPQWQEVDKSLFRSMLTFAVPIMPMAIMSWILNLSNRVVILHYCGEDAAGLFGIGTRFTTIVNVITSAIATAYTTFAFSNKENEDAKKQYSFVFNLVSLMLLFLSFSVALFGKEIISIMTHGDAYEESFRPLRDLMFAQTLYAMSTLVGYGIYFKKESKYSLLAVTMAAVVNLGLNILLIPRFGYAISATAQLIAYLVQLTIIYVISEKLYPCDYGMRKVAPLTVGLWLLCVLIRNAGLPGKFIAWLLCVIITIILFKDILIHTLEFIRQILRRKGT